jgi:cysteine-rich repeat protein
LSCTDSDTWRSFAETSCANKCSKETGKCGVNSFSTSAEPCGQATICGNGKVEPEEQCDDGNTKNGDGCSSICQKETQGTCIDSDNGVNPHVAGSCIDSRGIRFYDQ